MDASIDPVAGIEWLAGLFPVRAARRRPLTVMFTDIAGFTAYAATRGDRAAARLVQRHDRAVLPAIRRHSGRILKRLGDGLMAAFASPAAALRAALEMQQAARGVRLRIGFHAGAARSRAGDLIGHEVNVAARIAERALGGEILVSDAVRSAAGEPHLLMRVRLARPERLLQVVERALRLFDLDADPVPIADHLAGSPELAPLVARRPGLRVPGAWDAFELAVRAVLGQQVTVRGATTLAGRLVRAFGTPLDRAEDGLTHLFPRPEALADADLAALGLPRARAATIRALAGAVASGEVVLDASRGLEDAVARLAAVPGIGAWAALEFAERWPARRARFVRRLGDVELRRAADPAGVASRLAAYFGGDLAVLDRVAVDAGGTPFQRRVWAALRSIPPGETVSYQTLAQRIGAPAAVRAVGAANGANPVAIVVPCHRVIGADGRLTGYAGGIERKRWLLAHERAGVLEQRSLL